MVRSALWFCACNLATAVLVAQCTNPTQVPDQTISSGSQAFSDNNALNAASVVISGSASVTFVAGNCIELGPGFHATAGTAATTFHAWVGTAPSAVSVSPASGSGASSSFTWTVSSPSGYANLSEMQAIFNASLSGVNACKIQYLRSSNLLKVADTNGTNWSSGVVPGSSDTTGAFNPYCVINGAGSSVSSSGNQLSVTASITFQPAFAGAKNNYLIAYDQYGLNSGWQQVGTWTVVGAPGTPTITGLSPSAGATGTVVTISGSNFGSSQGASTVTFNGIAASVSSWSATSISATVPSGATSGNVIVTVGGVASNGMPFSVTTAPSISSLSATSGTVGASITISGANFGSSQGTSTVKFNGTAASVSSWSATGITATVPSGATSGNVIVTVGGVASNGISFTVTTAPSISSLSATSGAVGASITISGANFGSSQGTSTVKFNGTAASVSSWSATSITATVPSGATSGNVIVTVGGVASNGISFTVTTAPSISSLSATSGTVGASITISGANFGSSQGTSTVKFNGTVASVSSWSATSISATVPTGATSGNVIVTVGGVASNGISFTVTLAPSITSVTPNAGPVGASVVIAGANFGATQGSSTVAFNGTSAAVSSWSGTSISVTVPAGAFTGIVVVTVGGVASNSMPFTVTTAPTISTLSPTSAPAGTVVTITGANFGSSQGASTVKFNGTVASVSGWTATAILATVPTGATSGNVIVTVGGVASNGIFFTVPPTPSITSVSPNAGPVGAPVVITGTNFGATQGSSTVAFNGTYAAVSSWTATSISVTVPAGAFTGIVVVTVGGVASNSMPFTVTTAPTISSLSATAGPVGASITISGANFGSSQGTSTVKFNGTVASVGSWDATSISATVPSGATSGSVIVTVGGLASNGVSFSVTSSVVITGLSPTSGPVGTTVTISGSNFGATQGSSSVSFNGTAATAVTSWSPTSIVALVPTGAASGVVSVVVNGTTATSPQSFVVGAAGAPGITSITPVTAPIGTSVTIAGTNFGSTQGASTVSFNGVQATAVSWTASSILAAVPVGGSTGNVIVQVNSTSSNAFPFTVGAAPPTREYIRLAGRVVAIENAAPQVLPTISSLSVTSGAVGTSVTITGSNFGASQGSSAVRFNGTVAVATSWTATSIVTTAPAGATTGNVVVTVNGLNSNGVTFTVAAPSPTISTATLSAGRVSIAYSAGLSATGGTPPYTWSLASGPLPTGLNLFSNGTISGTPSSQGTFNFTVRVTDSASATSTKALSITVLAAPYATLNLSSPPHYTTGPYSQFTLWLNTNIPDTWFRMCWRKNGGTPWCQDNFGHTDGDGYWPLPGYFLQGYEGTWQEWVEFPGLVTSSPISFDVIAPSANLSISSTSFHVGDPFTLWLYTNIPNTWFKMCWNNGVTSWCQDNFDHTDGTGYWPFPGYFLQGSEGTWQEWIELPGDVISNRITFVVN